jgi:hypothetical protein
MSKQILTYIPLFFLLLLGQSVFCAEPETLEAAFKRVRPGSEPQAIIGFFKTNAPDLLDEIHAKRRIFPMRWIFSLLDWRIALPRSTRIAAKIKPRMTGLCARSANNAK